MKLYDIIKKYTGYENLDLYDNKKQMGVWESWYKGKVDSFHNYTVFNGKKHVKMQRNSLNVAKKICEDWANLLINEKTDITLSDETSQKDLETIFKNTKFWLKANEGIEKTFALGGGAFVLSVDDITVKEDGSTLNDGVLNISFLNATKVRPITIKDGEIIECAFINVGTVDTNISIHLLNKDTGNYEIHNVIAEGTDETNLKIKEETYFKFSTGSKNAWFFYLKPNIANNIDINSPLGISIFANSIDVLKEIDLIYDSYGIEFLLGRKRVFISAESVVIDRATGEPVDVFDSNDIAFYLLPEGNDEKLLINESVSSLRVTEHQDALQNQLNLLSYSCGFGTQHYRFDGGSITTATQVISENSEMFRSIKKHEILIEDMLVKMIKSIIYICNTFTPVHIDENVEINVKFDDSIIEDKEAQKTSDRLDVSNGVMSKAEYRSKWYNEDIDTAQEKIDEINELAIPDYE